jgi:homoserine kinase type II
MMRVGRIPPGAVPEEGLLDELRAELEVPLPEVPAGVIHGDLFRDNVLWRGGRIVALLDFESAAEGLLAYDLVVTVLAWTYGDRFDPDLVRALLEGYRSVRPLHPGEEATLPRLARRAATRFVVTRITDFFVRGAATGVQKDYRRFVARRDAIALELAPLLARSP